MGAEWGSCIEDERGYVTKDRSWIRELIHPSKQKGVKLSVAEATVQPGAETERHLHKTSDEVYFVLSGEGKLYLGDSVLELRPGCAYLIRAGTPHHVIASDSSGPLRILCCSSPPYSHEDTIKL